MNQPQTTYCVVLVFGTGISGLVKITPENSRIISRHASLKLAALRMAYEYHEMPGNYSILVYEGNNSRTITREENEIIVQATSADPNVTTSRKEFVDLNDPNAKVSEPEIDPLLANMLVKSYAVTKTLKKIHFTDKPDFSMKSAAYLAIRGFDNAKRECVSGYPVKSPPGMTNGHMQHLTETIDLIMDYNKKKKEKTGEHHD